VSEGLKQELWFWFVLLALAGALVGVGYFVGYKQTAMNIHRQAIETGHGYIVIVDSLSGATEFRWRAR
jgi:hypothetical protein